MNILKAAGLAAFLLAGTASAGQNPDEASPHAVVTTLMAKPLPEQPGKELVMLEVTYPPGSADPVHRHDAHAMVYLLEGSVVMALRGGQTVTLTPGQTFYEGPDDVHTIGRNASRTEPARFVVVLLKDIDKPILTPVQ